MGFQTFYILLYCIVLCNAASNARIPQKMATSPRAQRDPAPEECKYTRDQALKCFEHYIDNNNDNRISRREMQYAINHYLSRSQQQMFISADDFLHDCDRNRDGYVTTDDFEKSQKKCLASCDTITQFIHYICAPAQRDRRSEVQKRNAILQQPKNVRKLPQLSYKQVV